MNFQYRPEVLAFIREWEGLKLEAYLDTAGVWTIGIGTTDPKYAFPGNTITEELAVYLAREHIQKDIDACNQLVRVPTTPDQQTAIVSFCYNIGVPRFRGSTFLRKLNQGDYVGAYAEFPKWIYETIPGTNQKRVNRGLVNRRKDEADLFLKGMTVANLKEFDQPEKTSAEELESLKPTPASTSVVPVPPADPKPSTGPAVATGSLATAAVLQEASQDLAPLAPYSSYITAAFVVLTVLALIWTLKSRKS